MFQLTLWSITPLLAALVCVGAYLRLARQPRVPGMHAVLGMLATAVLWSGCQFADSLLTDYSVKLLVLKVSYVPLTLAPLLWLLFALGYARRRMHLSRPLRNLLALVPLTTICLAMTNEWHHLVWRSVRAVDADGFAGLVTDHGPWFYVHAAYGYGLIVVATTILAYALSTTIRQVRPVVGLIVAPLLVCGANLFSLSPWNPLPWFDFTTLGLAAAALILDRTVLRHGVLDNIPVLRDRVLEQLGEGVAVVDGQGRVIDVNRAALDILGGSRSAAIGAPLSALLPGVEQAGLSTPRSDPLEIHVHGHWYDVTGSRLDPSDPHSDVVLAFRDVTVRRDTEHALRRAQEELQRLAHTDSLTGLHNRRLFMDRLDEEARRVQRHAGVLSVVILDLDRFKSINDGYGHDAGDRILQAVAERVQAIKRATDVAARIGGEEFALLLPATDASGAAHLAERLCHAIAGIDTASLLGDGITVTASIGFATANRADSDPGALYKRADEAMYRAKNGGRNRVCSATG